MKEFQVKVTSVKTSAIGGVIRNTINDYYFSDSISSLKKELKSQFPDSEIKIKQV